VHRVDDYPPIKYGGLHLLVRFLKGGWLCCSNLPALVRGGPSERRGQTLAFASVALRSSPLPCVAAHCCIQQLQRVGASLRFMSHLTILRSCRDSWAAARTLPTLCARQSSGPGVIAASCRDAVTQRTCWEPQLPLLRCTRDEVTARP